MIKVNNLTAPVGKAGYIPYIELVRATGLVTVAIVGSTSYRRWRLSINSDGENVTIFNKYHSKTGYIFNIDLVSGDLSVHENYEDGSQELHPLYEQQQVMDVYKAFDIQIPKTEDQLNHLQKIKYAVDCEKRNHQIAFT